jgi:hypothetical protein
MKSTFLIIITSVLFGGSFHAQTSGLYGKRNYIEINGLSNFRLFGILFDESNYYKASGSSLVESRDIIDFGYRITLGRVTSDHFAFGIEGGMDFQSLGIPGQYFQVKDPNSYNAVYHKHEMLDIRTISIMPKISFTKKGGLLPIGLNHEIGIGYNSSKVVDKDYEYRIISGGEGMSAIDSMYLDKQYVDYDQRYGGMTFMYAFKVKTPISKRVMINYGLRYTLNLRNYGQFISSNSASIVSSRDIAFDLGRMRISNLMTFNLGITYAF